MCAARFNLQELWSSSSCIWVMLLTSQRIIYMAFRAPRCHHRRKFRSQTSEHMDRWKSRGGKSQRRAEKKQQDQRRERVRRKKMQARKKVEKSRITLFFQWVVAPEGWKEGHLGRWEIKKRIPLWREAHFEVKMYKTHQLRTTFGSWDVENVHAVVARSTFWKPLWREAHSKSKC